MTPISRSLLLAAALSSGFTLSALAANTDNTAGSQPNQPATPSYPPGVTKGTPMPNQVSGGPPGVAAGKTARLHSEAGQTASHSNTGPNTTGPGQGK
jgi:hypothetical protein